MDKSWMHADRRSRKFQLGVAEFFKFASANASNERKIRCPCLKCCNTDGFSIGVIKDHIFWNGIDESYKNWRWHGDPSMSYMNSRMQGESLTCIALFLHLSLNICHYIIYLCNCCYNVWFKL